MLLLSSVLISSALAASPSVNGPWEHTQVQAGELSMHVLVAGPADAPPVLLLHGFPDSSHGWRGVMPLLAQDHRVYAPDLRGYGGTDKPDGGYGLQVLSEDVIALLDALELERVDLIGHDWGAAISWEVAAAHPERFDSITVLSVPHPTALRATWDANPEQQDYARFATFMTRRITPRVLARVYRKGGAADVYEPELVNPAVLAPADAQHYQLLFDERAETTPPLRYYRENFRDWDQVWERADSFPTIEVPTLVLWGEQDSYMLVENAARSCEQVSARCEYAVHPEAMHWLHWEQAAWVVDQWRVFQGR